MPPYTMDMLAKLAGVTPRTVRYYIAQGLLPAPEFAGSATRYDDTHLRLIQAIKRLQAEHLPLAAIRAQLRELGTDEITRLAKAPDVSAPPEPSAALDYIRSVLGPAQPTADIQPAPSPAMRMAAPALAAAPPVATAPAPTPAFAPAEPTPGERQTWERISLEPDIELHVRRPLTRQQNRRLERLLALAREVIRED